MKTLTRWLLMTVTLCVAMPVEAQYRKTTLSAAGEALIEASPKELRGCTQVYQWERCHEPKQPTHASVKPDPERRKKCIISSRNVAAKKGATHYIVEGPIFSGYRCDGSGARRSARVSVSTEELEGRERSLGFSSWAMACDDIQELFIADCDREATLQAQLSCRERVALAMLDSSRLYRLASVKARVDKSPEGDAYLVNVLGVLTQLGARSDQQYVAVRPLMMARRGSATDALADAARPFIDVFVAHEALKAPKRFKRDLKVEALVRPKMLHAPSAHNPARVQVLETEIIGLRAYVQDMSWGKVIITPEEALPERKCMPISGQPQETP